MTKKASIYYFSLTDEMLRTDKLAWFDNTKFKHIEFDKILPDEKGNWLNLTDNDFESLLPVCDKEKEAIFKFSSLGVSTNRDEWVYDFSKESLTKKMQFFIKTYTELLKNNDDSWNESIKWSRDLKKKFQQKKLLQFNTELIKQANYRPFIKEAWYAEKILNDILTQNHYDIFGKELDKENFVICFSGQASTKLFQCLVVNQLSGLDFLEKTQCLPLSIYDKDGNRHDNITDWALNAFKNHYENPPQSPFNKGGGNNVPPFNKEGGNNISPFDKEGGNNIPPFFKGGTGGISKLDIFHYVYAVLHNPHYRTKYELNLKREFPRIPYYENFAQWAEWGKQLMELHLHYETIAPFPLKRHDLNPPESSFNKAKLKADKINGVIILDDNTTLSGVPIQAWEYKLGNRSALEWVLDQYKEKKPKDPTIAQKFNIYKFADYKEQVIDLLMKVCAVSLETLMITEAMKNQTR